MFVHVKFGLANKPYPVMSSYDTEWMPDNGESMSK